MSSPSSRVHLGRSLIAGIDDWNFTWSLPLVSVWRGTPR
ncbi:hypothetical protein AS9A_3459 [Hoyosella subflava DQS3-9A1]|uniref:Uncharacterized protein n=1 Tax=Hoyosella subflava (strain DSM 45089 / JCM 17490 / NBRC 109087 / DQS3-9A1) TaxID=443218 RepID=F6EQM3_HOYSD|nr:hypothetical protein AS9A_3459 [Hoyosella subflava DQS3-9A1]